MSRSNPCSRSAASNCAMSKRLTVGRSRDFTAGKLTSRYLFGKRHMIIENQKDVTTAVLTELKRAPNARFREIMSAFVRHMHDFAREAKLTEEEFHAALAYVVAIGRHNSQRHNHGLPVDGSLSPAVLPC